MDTVVEVFGEAVAWVSSLGLIVPAAAVAVAAAAGCTDFVVSILVLYLKQQMAHAC